MQTIGDFRDWMPLTTEDQYALPGNRVRPVTLEVNSAGAVALHIVRADGEVHFLGRFFGRDKARFVALPGDVLICEAVEVSTCWIHTKDGEVIHRSPSVKEAFTRYHERQPFDPRQQAILMMMQSNARRMDAAVEEMRRTKEALDAERARADQAEATARAAAQAAAGAGGDGGTGPDAGDTGESNPAG